MTEKIKKILSAIKGILLSDPRKFLMEEKDLVNQPFYFEGQNGKAVLLVHGWTSTSYEVRRLGKYLNENGYTVLGPLLKGHGMVPNDLEGLKWEEWVNQLRGDYLKLKETHQKVYGIGTSIGANLLLMLAKENPEISALVLMATPFHIRLEKIAILAAKIVKLFKPYNRKYYPPTFGSSSTITRVISYQTYPISSALETFLLVKATRKIIPEVKNPVLILQSNSDHVISSGSLEQIYKRIGSKIKKKHYINRAYHTFISDIRNEHVFEDILKFIDEN